MADEWKNVVISVLKHFEDNLAVVSSIDLPGIPFDTDAVTEWYEPRLLGPASTPTRQGERFEGWILNVNCYAKTGRDSSGTQLETIHRHIELADSAFGVFSQANVPIKNWAAGGDPIIAYLRFGEGQGTPLPSGTNQTQLQQVNASFEGTLIF